VALDFIEMRKKIQEALQCGKFFIRLTYVDEKLPENQQLQHYYMTRDFPREDIMTSIEHVAKQVMGETLETDEEGDTS
jgi:hypothetical protein